MNAASFTASNALDHNFISWLTAVLFTPEGLALLGLGGGAAAYSASNSLITKSRYADEIAPTSSVMGFLSWIRQPWVTSSSSSLIGFGMNEIPARPRDAGFMPDLEAGRPMIWATPIPDPLPILLQRFPGDTRLTGKPFITPMPESDIQRLIWSIPDQSGELRRLTQLEGFSIPDMPDMSIFESGRHNKQNRLRSLVGDDRISSSDRGWIQQELNSISRGDRMTIRVPIGKQLAHRRGFEAAKGYDYSHADLQDVELHKLQHKYDGMGKQNKDRGKQE